MCQQRVQTPDRALGAAFWAAAPVWKQSRFVSVQAAIDLLDVVEKEAEKVADEIDTLIKISVLSTRLGITLHHWTGRPEDDADVFQALSNVAQASVLETKDLAARPHLTPDDRKKRQALRPTFALFKIECRQVQSNLKRPLTKGAIAFAREKLKARCERLERDLGTVIKDLRQEESRLQAEATRLRRLIRT